MRISKITLINFRIYKGENSIRFKESTERNISLVSGRNGFGKTTFLTSLVWAFYGKLMSQVDETYRKDIKSNGGYENYLESLVNNDVILGLEKDDSFNDIMSVEIELNDLMIPSIPCKEIKIKRSFYLASNKEELSILIDGDENELTKEVGYDVFINDFILPREVAKFFFFDAEKIVSLAEAKSKEELKSLSKAYSEVLGIKKYEDLKKNLDALLTKLKRNNATDVSQSEIEDLITKQKEYVQLVDFQEEKIEELKRENQLRRKRNDEIQEKLIREGNSVTLEELKELRNEKSHLQISLSQLKSRLNKLLEVAPLIIAGNKLHELNKQLRKEKALKDRKQNPKATHELLANFSSELLIRLEKLQVLDDKVEVIKKETESLISDKKKALESEIDDTRIIIDFDDSQYLKFESLYNNIKGSFSSEIETITREEKKTRVLLIRVNNKIKQAEARKDNSVAKKYRSERDELLTEISKTENKLSTEKEKLGELKYKQIEINRKLSQLEKHFKLDELDRKKYEISEQLLSKVNKLITNIKQEKKYALQKALKLGLNKLMHKKGFIKDVIIHVEDDYMKIDLIDSLDNIINKDTLSKGEQQLYATALLKALIDESGILFPVFIDSPLQKFDKEHSRRIIEEFYPSIVNQVILLPLLEKELTQNELMLLEPSLDQIYLIENQNGTSVFKKYGNQDLAKKLQENVFAN